MVWRRIRELAIFDYLLVAGMVIMSLLVLVNVILRYAFNSGLPFSVEVSRFAFVWVVFLGAIVALKDDSHLGVDTIVRKLPRLLAYVCFVISHAIMLWCCWLLWQGSWIQTKVNLGNLSPISGISVGFMYAAGLVAAIGFALIIIGRLWSALRGNLPFDDGAGDGDPHEIADPRNGESR
tara:strand:+ start:570 stop:1106 length:537 start_codon:yes stop_codon:yes gene_type:complete